MSIKVLLADDSGVMRKIIARALAAAGVTNIVEAADGDEAWTRFSSEPFDLVLSDWNMPGRTGLELLTAIRGSGSKTPVILVTTEAEKSRILDAIRAGVSDYVIKPFEQDALKEKLEKFIAAAATA